MYKNIEEKALQEQIKPITRYYHILLKYIFGSSYQYVSVACITQHKKREKRYVNCRTKCKYLLFVVEYHL